MFPIVSAGSIKLSLLESEHMSLCWSEKLVPIMLFIHHGHLDKIKLFPLLYGFLDIQDSVR